MTNTSYRRTTWGFPHLPLTDQLWLLAITAGVTFVSTMLVAAVAGRFVDVKVSGWEIVSGVAPWYLAVMAGWIMYYIVPLFIAHGQTRRFAFETWLKTGAVLVPVASLIMAIGYPLERWIYGLLGYPNSTHELLWFDSDMSFFMVFVRFVLTFLVWYVIGGLVGGAWYRSADWGWLSVLVGALAIGLAGVYNSTGGWLFGFARRLIPSLHVESLPLDLALAIGVSALVAWIIWINLRELALNNL